ncbi:MAG: bifunctional 5,10-methylenetetrahydrofolate dehydrogenase/5,10-methenyltetrahydrofolate cyclohydrolase [Peptostreptococcaceae bacterium]|nr:bifunctional 5,10-methylenetetrahydrofolate dehydrogenase/5,10-methenyltetrahydrofolate cyclohydrolase [Peptostreptococcaceae bacterium]
MLLMGKPVADKIKEEILKTVRDLRNAGKDNPGLAILRVGEREDDIAYESSILKNCATVGIDVEVVQIDNDIDMASFLDVIEKYNNELNIQGILIFRPLPEQLDIKKISKAIKPEKDIDCMNPMNMEKVFEGDTSGILPCTPEAVIEILKYYQYDLTGKNVAIVNRSMVLGRPLSMLFLNENATVTICHSKTIDLPGVTSKADIVITGAGKGNYFGTQYFSEKAVVIDVGINFENGSLCGDVDFDSVSEQVTAITPVPGGVGTVTSMILLKNVINAMKLQSN